MLSTFYVLMTKHLILTQSKSPFIPKDLQTVDIIFNVGINGGIVLNGAPRDVPESTQWPP